MKALVLSGGGSKGSYQLGVWKALKKLNIKFDIVTGTSVGALNGALIVQNDFKKALRIWNKINFKVLFGEDVSEVKNDLELYKLYGKEFLTNGGMNTKELETIIKKAINPKKFYKSTINYGLVTYNLTDKIPVELAKQNIPTEQLSDYLLASSSCFPAFQEKEINKDKYIDGGYYDNLPINLAIDMGATEIIAVDLNAPGIKKTPKKKIKTTIIKPKNKLTNFLNFNKEGAKQNMRLGYNDTMKAFGKYEGRKYTFKKNNLYKNKKTYHETYLHILNKILKYKKAVKSFEKIIKTEIKLDDDLKNDILEKLLLRIMEKTAKSFNLNNTKIYSYKSFNKELIKKLKKYLKEEQKTNIPCPKKEVQLYKQIIDEEYKELRTEALLNPIDLLKAIYLYTICED